MPPNAMEYGNEHERNEHLDLDVRAMAHSSPEKDNDLLLEAFGDVEFTTENLAHSEREPENLLADPENEYQAWREAWESRARSFAREICEESKHELISYEHGEPVMSPAKFSRNHGENWLGNMAAAAGLHQTISSRAENFIIKGLMEENEQGIHYGRHLLDRASAAAQEAADNPELCRRLNEAQEGFREYSPHTDEEQDRDMEARTDYVQAILEAVQDEDLAQDLAHWAAQEMVARQCDDIMRDIITGIQYEMYPDHVAEKTDPGRDIVAAEIFQSAQAMLNPEDADSPAGRLVHSLQEGNDEALVATDNIMQARDCLSALVGLLETEPEEHPRMKDIREGIRLAEGIIAADPGDEILKPENLEGMVPGSDEMEDYTTGRYRITDVIRGEQGDQAAVEIIPPDGMDALSTHLTRRSAEHCNEAYANIERNDPEEREELARHITRARILAMMGRKDIIQEAVEHRFPEDDDVEAEETNAAAYPVRGEDEASHEYLARLSPEQLVVLHLAEDFPVQDMIDSYAASRQQGDRALIMARELNEGVQNVQGGSPGTMTEDYEQRFGAGWKAYDEAVHHAYRDTADAGIDMVRDGMLQNDPGLVQEGRNLMVYAHGTAIELYENPRQAEVFVAAEHAVRAGEELALEQYLNVATRDFGQDYTPIVGSPRQQDYLTRRIAARLAPGE